MTRTHDTERRLCDEITDLVAVALPEVEVLAVELTGAEQFCVYVDHPQGVDHDLCSEVTRVLWGYLERYSVQVSSPGLERPLRTQAHFAAHLGAEVSLKSTSTPSRRRLSGRIVRAAEDAVELERAEGSLLVPYEELVRANLIDRGAEQ